MTNIRILLLSYQLEKLCLSGNNLICVTLIDTYVVWQSDEKISLLCFTLFTFAYMWVSSFGDNYNCTLNALTKKTRQNKKSAYGRNRISPSGPYCRIDRRPSPCR
jgi:hypothetical protein